jgi:pyruvate/2-oxoglutarate dehydrogenase complex dihydrolipoamide acyltransferase (E2) component
LTAAHARQTAPPPSVVTIESGPRPRRPLRADWVRYVLPLVAIWIVPVAAFAAAIPSANLSQSQALAPLQVTTTRVGSSTDDGTQAVDVQMTLTPATPVKSAASGTLTSITAKTGEALTQGTELATVNDAPVVAFVADAPLFRDVGPTTKGPDVASVAQFLQAQGLLPTSSATDTYSAALGSAIDAFERRQGQPADGTLHQSAVAWVRTGTPSIGQIVGAVGDVIGPGTALVSGSQTPTSTSFSVTGAESANPPEEPNGTLRLTVGASHVDFASLTPTAAEQNNLLHLLQSGVASGAVTTKAAGTSTTYSGGILQLADSHRVGTVPSSAVYAAPNGTACIFLRHGSGYTAVHVTNTDLINGELNAVAVSASLVGSNAVKNPAALPGSTVSACK